MSRQDSYHSSHASCINVHIFHLQLHDKRSKQTSIDEIQMSAAGAANEHPAVLVDEGGQELQQLSAWTTFIYRSFSRPNVVCELDRNTACGAIGQSHQSASCTIPNVATSYVESGRGVAVIDDTGKFLYNVRELAAGRVQKPDRTHIVV